MFAHIQYASPSAFNAGQHDARLALAASLSRPVHFRGKVVEHVFYLRCALRALGQLIWSEDNWASDSDFMGRVLDPVITVHPDRIWFEAFSQDMSAYGALLVDPALFQAEGETRYGTTNIDFTAWLWGALGEMRSSRATWFQIGAEGLAVSTQGAGGRFEQKVDIPDRWVRGFLQLQGAMALPGTRLQARPVDILSAIRFLQTNKAKVSPRALRYEFTPGEPVSLMIEPWNHRIVLQGSDHTYAQPHAIRTWGRRRLRLLEPLLPFAEKVDVYLKGRALPSFYAVQLPGMTFLLGLSGHSGSGFGDSGSFDLNMPTLASSHTDAVLDLLRELFHLTTSQVAQHLRLSDAEATRALTTLVYSGRVMYDVQQREWRHRELFDPPITDASAFFPPDPRREEAQQLIQQGVTVVRLESEDFRKVRRYRCPMTGAPMEKEVVFPQWRVAGSCGQHQPEIVISAEERLIFGQCNCAFFKEHLLNRGPCSHMLALYEVSASQRQNLTVKPE